jgi:endogenous inhibitor of DNA gyrase (YacG/DUF329 family)
MPAEPPKAAGPGKGAPKSSQKGSKKGSAKPCPICGKPATEASHPFCSERCRDVDLNRWLSNSYAIPGRKDEDEDQE